MNNSKYYLKKAVKERMHEVLTNIFFTLAFLLIIAPIAIYLENVYLSLFPLVLIILNSLVFSDNLSRNRIILYFEKSDREFKKEELIKEFNKSPSYLRYARTEVADVDKFVQAMNMLIARFDELDNLVVFDSALSELTYNECPNEVLACMLMNPRLLEGRVDSIISQINKFNSTLNQHPYANEVHVVSKNNQFITNPASKTKIHDISDELSSILRDVVVSCEHFIIRDIDGFLKDVNINQAPGTSRL